MTAFTSPTDIGNRAAQFLGANRMDPVLGFNDTSSRTAAEISFVYDKLRQAELERNDWTCAIRRTVLRPVDSSFMLLAPALWNPAATYFVGSIVADQSQNYWQSRIPNNLNNDPLLTAFWEPYFGPLAIPLYDTSGTTAYFAGEVVYTAAGDGTYRVYLSLIGGNSDNPATATPWSATTTYFKNMVVTFSSVAYMSLIDLNTNQQPSLSPANWSAVTTYTVGQKVNGSDGITYQSIGSGNLNHDPTLDGGVHWSTAGVLTAWTTVFTGGSGSSQWLEIGGAEAPSGVALTKLNVIYPLGAGPATQGNSRNAFKLPSGFLKEAQQNPKGTANPLGGPSGYSYDDWNFENGYLVSSTSSPIALRFVADLTDVRLMHALFCEGLATHIAVATCTTITQSDSKLQGLASQYQKFMGEARTINAIESGYDDPPDDDYLTVRL
jgi:hypothetical protein